ncbi:hypothetical protein KC325_g74 [Hortaea werneckii]|nr:hypothetical protein KC325_g74 [Hortaea werneckii]
MLTDSTTSSAIMVNNLNTVSSFQRLHSGSAPPPAIQSLQPGNRVGIPTVQDNGRAVERGFFTEIDIVAQDPCRVEYALDVYVAEDFPF